MTEPDRTEGWLREGLAGAVPDPPGEPGRAEAARGRARRARRRTTIVAAAGVAATLAVVGVVTTTLRDGSARNETATATSPFDVPECPDKPVDAKTQVGPDRIPDGAVSVRLCSGTGVPLDAPGDALVANVADVADAVNGLEAADPQQVCTLVLGIGYQLVFGYPDGTTTVASGSLYGCREVIVNGVKRADADIPWELFIERLRAQREQLDPPTLATAPAACKRTYGETPAGTPLGRPQDLEVAVLCTDALKGGSRAEISTDELNTLLADLESRSVANAGYLDCGAPRPSPRIEGLTAWGDRVSLQAECGNGWFTVDSATNTVWQPSPAATKIIERLVSEAR